MDTFQNYRIIDPDGMSDMICNFPQQLLDGKSIVKETNLEDIDVDGIENILLLGMGGSAIGGDLVRAYAEDALKVPFLINRTYQIPAFVSRKTLVIASSYSGNTEETLEALDYCIEKDARIICISTNGKLEKVSSSYPFLRLPKGFQPRAALGLSFSVVLLLLDKLGFIEVDGEQFESAYQTVQNGIEEYGKEIPTEENQAKKIAKLLHKRLPILYTSSKIWNTVGVRIRGQIEENAKMLAYSNEFPEMNHNEIVGYNQLGNLKELLAPVFIMDENIHPRVRFRMEHTKDIFADMGIESITIHSKGDGVLARMMNIIQLGDFISYYLAILNEVDPMPVLVIEKLKEKLKQFEDKR